MRYLNNFIFTMIIPITIVFHYRSIASLRKSTLGDILTVSIFALFGVFVWYGSREK